MVALAQVWGCSHDVGGVYLKTSRDVSKKTHWNVCRYCIHYCTHPSMGRLAVSQHGSWLSPVQAIQHSKVEASMLLMTLAVTLCQAHRVSSIYCWRKISQGRKTRQQESRGRIQEAGYHRCVDSFISHYFTFLLLPCLEGEGVRRGKLGIAQLAGTAKSNVLLQGLR